MSSSTGSPGTREPTREPEDPNDAGAPAAWPPGTRVAVRNRFTSGWADGFVVEDTVRRRPAQYRLRRLSDNAVLPASFSDEDLRKA